MACNTAPGRAPDECSVFEDATSSFKDPASIERQFFCCLRMLRSPTVRRSTASRTLRLINFAQELACASFDFLGPDGHTRRQTQCVSVKAPPKIAAIGHY